MHASVTRVLIIDEDVFAAEAMLLLLARDARTRVVGQVTPAGLPGWKGEADLVILGSAGPVWDAALLATAESLAGLSPRPCFICTCTRLDNHMLSHLARQPHFAGCLLKAEVGYGLVSAVCLAAGGYCVLTPGLRDQLDRTLFPRRTLLIGPNRYQGLHRGYSHNALEVLKLALLHNLSQYEISNELVLAESYIAQVISQGYNDLGIPDLVNGEVTLEELFSDQFLDNQLLIHQFGELTHNLLGMLERRSQGLRSPRFRNMGTLAYHLLTIPAISEWQQTG